MLAAWIKFVLALWLVIGGAFFFCALAEIMFVLLFDWIAWLIPVFGIITIAKAFFK